MPSMNAIPGLKLLLCLNHCVSMKLAHLDVGEWGTDFTAVHVAFLYLFLFTSFYP